MIRVFVLKEEDEETGTPYIGGIFSTKELAEEAHHFFEKEYTKHYPTSWEVVEYYVDSQILKIMEMYPDGSLEF